MILEKQTDNIILTEGDVSESINMELDLDSAQILMQMLSKNLYSDAIGSTVRETCSNALDSHRKANTDDPIIVSFKSNNDNTYSFCVQDFGTGLDADDVENIISKYGKSTKRLEANSLGMMGLGFKSPLAYSSSFTFVCRKDGMEWTYMMYEGEDSNKIDLLYSQKTIEKNGVKVIIPVKYSDKNEFLTKIREQLAYFENVFFDTGNVSNDFIIHRAEHYQISPLVNSSLMHICLDNVYYPIDFEKLGIPPIHVVVGLRFGLSDGIFPTPNREAIRMTQEAKKTILSKIAKVADVFITMYNNTIVATSDIQTVFEYYKSQDRLVTISDKTYNVFQLKNYSSIKITSPTLIGVELLNLEDLYEDRENILGEYQIRYNIKNRKMSEVKSGGSRNIRLYDLNNTHYYLYNQPISGKKKEYLKSICSYGDSHVCKKIDPYKLGFNSRKSWSSTSSYYSILNLKNYKRTEWRQRIKEFQFIQQKFTEKFIGVDSMEIPQSYIDARKKERVSSLNNGNGRRVKLTGELFGKTAMPLERYVSGQNCKFVADTYILADIPKYKGLTVYDSYDNQPLLDSLYYVTRNCRHKLRILSFSNREMKVLNDINIHNLISYSKFMEGENKPFKRLITAHLINTLMSTYNHVFSKRDYLTSISQPLLDKLNKLSDYKNDYYCYADSNIYVSMLSVAEEHMLFDMKIYSDYLDIKNVFLKLTFLNTVMKTIKDYENDPMIPILVDLFKYYRYRIDYKNYHIPLNEMIDFDSLLLTDETVNELTII